MYLKLRTLLLPFFVVVFSVFSTAAQAQIADTASVRTDKDDYLPGDLVTITGGGFEAGETVTLQVEHTGSDPDGTDPQHHQPWTTVAKGDGTIESTWTVPTDGDALGASLVLTADGELSQKHAEWYFTDGNISTPAKSGTWSGTTITYSDNSTQSIPTGSVLQITKGSVITIAPNTTVQCQRVEIGQNGTGNTGTLTFSAGSKLIVTGSTASPVILGDVVVGTSSNTGTLDMSAGGTLQIVNAFTINSAGTFKSTATDGLSGGTIEYNGAAQTITPTTYYNLTLSPASTTSVTKSLSGNITVKGDLKINNNATLSAGANAINIGGNWTNNGTFSAGTGSVNFNSTGSQKIIGNSSFNSVVISSATLLDGSTLTANHLTFATNGVFNLNYGTVNIANAGIIEETGGNFNSAATGNVTFLGSGTVKGAVQFYTDVVITNGSVSFSSNSVINAGLQLMNTTSIISTPPLYAIGSTLRYWLNGTISRGAEWSNTGTNPGSPYNVQLMNSPATYLNMGNTVAEVRNLLYIGTASTINMQSNTNPLTVGGFSSAGTFIMSSQPGSNLKVFGSNGFGNDGSIVTNGRSIVLNGTTDQTIVSSTPLERIIIDKSSGNVRLNALDLTISNNLTFATSNTANIFKYSYDNIKVIITNPNPNAIVKDGPGFVNVVLQRAIATGSNSYLYPIGDGTRYAPATVSFNNVSVAGNLSATTTTGDYANIATANINASKSVNRSWTITKDNALAFSNYGITLGYDASDNDDASVASSYILGKYDGTAWTYPTITGTPTSTSISATGLTDFSTFAVGKKKNTAPVATTPQSETATEDINQVITPSATDADGDALTFEIVSNPSHGTVTVNADGTFTYKPGADYNGSDAFTYKAKDSKGEYSNVATINVSVAAVNDVPSFTKGTDQTVNEDAGAQTVTTWATAISKGGGSDEAGQTLTFTVTNDKNNLFSVQPTIDASGKLTYTPAANANGSATITVSLSDDGSNTAPNVNTSAAQTFTITVNAVNDAPAGADNTVTTLEDNSYTFTTADFGFTDATDVPANTLLDIRITALPTAGSLRYDGTAITATGLGINAADIAAGKLTFSPAANANGSGYSSFTFKVQDNGGTTNGGVDLDPSANTMTVDVTAVNDAPTVAHATANVTVNEDATSTVIDLSSTFDDVDGDALTVTVSGNTNTSLVTTTYNATTKKLTLDYGTNAHGIAAITINAADASANVSDEFTVTVNSVNDAPSGADNTVTTLEDNDYTFSTSDFGFSDGNDDPANNLLDVRISSLPAAGSLKYDGTAITTTGLGISAADIAAGKLTFSPVANANGSGYGSFTFKVQDDGGTANGGVDLDASANTITVDVTPVNDAPEATPQSVTTNEDVAKEITLAGTDIDGDALTYTPGTPAHGTLVHKTGNTYTYTPDANYNGSDAFTFTANDGKLDSDPVTVNITVTAVNDAPTFTIASDPAAINEDGGTQSVSDFVTNINDGDPELTQTLHFNITGNSNTNLFSTAPAIAADGTLTYTPAANANGTAVIKVTLSDDGSGTAPDDNTSDEATFTITVNAVNDAPSFTKGTNQTINEDAGAQTVTGWATGINDGDPELNQTLTFNVTGNTNPSLFSSAPAIDATGNLTYTPAANANGSATITVTLSDDGSNTAPNVNTSAAKTFTITINAVNDAPAFTKGTDQVVNEDAGAQTVNGWATAISKGGGSDEAGQVVTFTVTNNTNPTLFSDAPAIDATGKLTYTPAANANGEATISVKISDDGGTENGGIDESAVQTFVITVRPVNDAPSGTDKTVTILEDNSYTFSVSDFGFSDVVENNSFKAVKVTSLPSAGTLSLNGSAVTTGQSVLTSDISASKLTFTPAANANGSGYASFTFQVQDNGGTANGGEDLDQTPNTFTIDVTPVNDVPVFTKGADKSVLEDAGAQSVTAWASNISDGDPELNQSLTFNVTNDNPSLFTTTGQPAVDASGKLTFTPAVNANGSATVTITLSDDGSGVSPNSNTSASQTFVINVTAVNDAPSFTKGANQSVNEDAGAQTVNVWATNLSPGGGNDEASQILSFTVTNDNNSLFSSQPAIDASGKLTYTSATNANGSATVSVNINDNGGTANGGVDQSAAQTFTITINAVNDAPTFVKGSNQEINEDAAAQSISNWATAISAGPANESTQSLSFTVTNDKNGLFSVQPAVSATGTLTYSVAANANGVATVSVKVKDDGGVLNGGVDESAMQTFTITVNSVNDAPAGADNTVTTLEDNSYTFTTADFGFTDANDVPANTLSSVKITTLPGAGTLKLGTNPVAAGAFILAADITAGNLKFCPAANANGTGYASFTFQVKDNGGTAYSGVDLDQSANTITINVTPVNDAPVVTNNKATQNVQYSDLIVPVSLTISDVDDANLTVSTSYKKDGGAVQAGLPSGISLIQISNTINWTLSGNAMIASGTYVITITAKDPSNAIGTTVVEVVVKAEDANVTYSGIPYFATSSATSNTATVTLSATIKDITAMGSLAADPKYDPNGGIITNAKVTFRRDNPTTGTILGTANVPVVLVGSDVKVGTASATFNYTLSTSEMNSYGTTLTVYAVVGDGSGYYTGVNVLPGAVTITLPGSQAVNGGGYLKNVNSIGTYAGTAGVNTNFGFTMQYSKNGSSAKGQANIIIRSNNKTYQIKSNAINSLSTGATTATGTGASFSTKANLTDVTNPLVPIALGGNLDLFVNMNDSSNGGKGDEASILLQNGSTILFSSYWNGSKTALQKLGGGNIQVRNTATQPVVNINQAIQMNTAVLEVTDAKFGLTAFPNPTQDQFKVHVESSNKTDKIMLRVFDAYGRTVRIMRDLTAGQTMTLGNEYRPGTYYVEMIQGKNRTQVKLLKVVY